jgi:NAD(P)-dependent dehydrogenase (short-subunit alcohol dehydrogenase family)
MNRVAIVTGANRGLGLALVRGLCRQWGGEGTIYLTARNPERGRQAVELLRGEKLAPTFHALDIADVASIHGLADHIRSQHGGVDVLIQNAAYAALPGVPGAVQARTMMHTNNHGTARLLEAMRPLLRDGARVLVVASGFGTLAQLPPHLQVRFDTDHMSQSQLGAVMDEYVQSVERGTAQAEGWPEWINIPSKIGQVAAMRIFARELAGDAAAPRDVLVNAVCPGWTVTEASRPYLEQMPNLEARTPDESAEDVLWLAALPPGTRTPYGELVQFRRVIPFR